MTEVSVSCGRLLPRYKLDFWSLLDVSGLLKSDRCHNLKEGSSVQYGLVKRKGSGDMF